MITTTCALLCCAAVVCWWAPDDNHSLRYLLWKREFYPFPGERLIYNALKLDVNRDALVRGLSVQALHSRFPHAHEQAITMAQDYQARQHPGVIHLWLGSSEMVIVLKNGLGHSIDLWKG